MKKAIVGIAILLLLGLGSGSVRGATAEPGVKKTCHTVKKKVHGRIKKVKVCKAVVKPTLTKTPKPTATATVTLTPTVAPTVTATATPTVTPTPKLASVSVGLASVDPRLTVSRDGSNYVFTDPVLGGHIEFDSLHIGLDDKGQQQFYAHVSASKSPSPNDGEVHGFDMGSYTTVFSLVAGNLHPYYFNNFAAACNELPAFQFTQVYNGETDSGWICTHDLPQGATGQYTLNITSSAGDRIGDYVHSPLLTVTITEPA
jgi:hypothetical protein